MTLERVSRAELLIDSNERIEIIIDDWNRFIASIRDYIGKTTDKLIPSVIDEMSLLKAQFKQGISERLCELRADVLVKNNGLMKVYYFKTKIKIGDYSICQTSQQDEYIKLNTIQVVVPAYQRIEFVEVTTDEQHEELWKKQ